MIALEIILISMSAAWFLLAIFAAIKFSRRDKEQEHDEIYQLEQTLKEKQKELYTRNKIERLSKQIERLDEHLYPEEKEWRWKREKEDE